MPRKEKTMITEELKKIILSLAEDERKTIKEIASNVNLNRNDVSRIIRGIPLNSSREPNSARANETSQRILFI